MWAQFNLPLEIHVGTIHFTSCNTVGLNAIIHQAVKNLAVLFRTGQQKRRMKKEKKALAVVTRQKDGLKLYRKTSWKEPEELKLIMFEKNLRKGGKT